MRSDSYRQGAHSPEPARVGGPADWSTGGLGTKDADLNASQRRAVDHRDGPLLIAAGAGTGKTRTLVSRLARLLDDGVAPERVLLVTFSRRAAAELTRRAGS
jgi:ATP-dependent exoDNAse (exonuclease V) beta subunit